VAEPVGGDGGLPSWSRRPAARQSVGRASSPPTHWAAHPMDSPRTTTHHCPSSTTTTGTTAAQAAAPVPGVQPCRESYPMIRAMRTAQAASWTTPKPTWCAAASPTPWPTTRPPRGRGTIPAGLERWASGVLAPTDHPPGKSAARRRAPRRRRPSRAHRLHLLTSLAAAGTRHRATRHAGAIRHRLRGRGHLWVDEQGRPRRGDERSRRRAAVLRRGP